MQLLLFVILLPFFLIGVIPALIGFALSGKDPGPTRNAIDLYATSVLLGVLMTVVGLAVALVYK